MVERDYSQMAPQELNSELGRLYEQLPSKIEISPDAEVISQIGHLLIVDDKDANREENRRKRSKHRLLLMEKLDLLLAVSPITNSFRRYIKGSIRWSYQMGEDKDLPEESLVLWMFDKDIPGSGGIFDSLRARDLERIGYNEFLDRCLWLQKFNDSKSHSWVRLLKSWRRQYFEKYGDEP